MKTSKIFECACLDGFTGDFCEFKTQKDHLLFISPSGQFIFNANERLIEENAIIDELKNVVESCSTMLNGEAVIFGGYWQPVTDGFSWATGVSVVSDCTLKHLGDLPGGFYFSSCETFMIKSLTTILGCFNVGCQSLRRKNDGALSDINVCAFDAEFEIDSVAIMDPTHDHDFARVANYQGFPLILGGNDNNKLEMLNTIESPARWVEFADYPYSTA